MRCVERWSRRKPTQWACLFTRCPCPGHVRTRITNASWAKFAGRRLPKELRPIAFGDLFLADIRAYRERQLRDTGLEPFFPLWQIPTGELACEMIRNGLRARLTCVDLKVLPREFAGREFDASLLADLPAGIDPCGENGEFHSFVYDGPMFREPVKIVTGEIVERDGFAFADLDE
jgi:diphthamide synthase (EF-2-diphthine--ammonia ligase)